MGLGGSGREQFAVNRKVMTAITPTRNWLARFKLMCASNLYLMISGSESASVAGCLARGEELLRRSGRRLILLNLRSLVGLFA